MQRGRILVPLGCFCPSGILQHGRWLAAALRPPPRLDRRQRLPSGRADCQLVHARRAGSDALEFDTDPRDPANIGAESTTTCCHARRDLVESPPNLVLIAATGVVGRVCTHALPDREQQFPRQSVSNSLDNRIELVVNALAVKLGGDATNASSPVHVHILRRENADILDLSAPADGVRIAIITTQPQLDTSLPSGILAQAGSLLPYDQRPGQTSGVPPTSAVDDSRELAGTAKLRLRVRRGC